MRKIINGKVYDTKTATQIAYYQHSHKGDHSYYDEDLYRKRTGEYFIWGEGGPSSKYAEPYPTGGWQGGSAIVPLNYEDALQWAENHMDADDYEKEFGEIDEDLEKRNIGLSIATSSYEKIKRTAQGRGVSISALIEEFAESL